MKLFAFLFCFYLFALTTLPSVRAIRMQFIEQNNSCSHNSNASNQEPSGCEKGKIIMNLSFNPVHYETPQSFNNCIKTTFIEIAEKENATHKKVFISQYKNSIWQPPKIFSIV
jgi:hypothetical protein